MVLYSLFMDNYAEQSYTICVFLPNVQILRVVSGAVRGSLFVIFADGSAAQECVNS